ncbi:hypothetical protein PHYBOEH_007319 [Phytophthora boehmeriae]|uniref:Phosphatidylinositol-glycan biosynthesis class X protein n=1 Tax=Phytophthora boehmeriae TaxID=109152 RepID=A0A8T1X7X3_9STRA|nr:hypothetical protein PHYBOEH_007319 [Phytophthora boehmeriae]
MDLKILEPGACGGDYFGNKTILVRVPISSTSYLDLDEIRRMERFREVKLLAFTKHIEIERPSPVSSQHVVGLEFAIPSSSDQVHVEYPIHFRYQAPSESELYRQAVVVAPEVYLFCPSKDESAAKTLRLFQTWGITSASDAVATRIGNKWLRLSLSLPLAAIEVQTPVGYLPSDWLVSSGTLLFAILGAALLLWVSYTTWTLKSSGSDSPTTARWKAKVE